MKPKEEDDKSSSETTFGGNTARSRQGGMACRGESVQGGEARREEGVKHPTPTQKKKKNKVVQLEHEAPRELFSVFQDGKLWGVGNVGSISFRGDIMPRKGPGSTKPGCRVRKK